MRKAVILGCGFTGSRVARSLRALGWETICTSRSGDAGFPLDVADPASLATLRSIIDPETWVLHSVPVPGVIDALRQCQPVRVVYLSTTGVYGATEKVDETTPPSPRTERELARAREENAVVSGPWEALVLRPAAIYGPGRGVHASMRAGTYSLAGDGGNFVSRIHVDDLAAHCVAGLLSRVTGAYPVADDEPCTSREIAEYCAGLLGMATPGSANPGLLGETRRANRRVDGSAIRRLLGIHLKYPSYREGIAACLEEEARAFSTS
jgi:nucleoside-diphosphate-sugar epimerase